MKRSAADIRLCLVEGDKQTMGICPKESRHTICTKVRNILGEVLAVKLTTSKPSSCFFVGETTSGDDASGDVFLGDALYDSGESKNQ